MRPPRRVRRRKGGNHLSISARNAEWEAVRASADRAGLPIARYVKRLVDRDLGGDWGFTALAPEEQRELLEAMREIRALLREGVAPPADDREPVREAPARLGPRKSGSEKSSAAVEPDGPAPRQGSLFGE